MLHRSSGNKPCCAKTISTGKIINDLHSIYENVHPICGPHFPIWLKWNCTESSAWIVSSALLCTTISSVPKETAGELGGDSTQSRISVSVEEGELLKIWQVKHTPFSQTSSSSRGKLRKLTMTMIRSSTLSHHPAMRPTNQINQRTSKPTNQPRNTQTCWPAEALIIRCWG